MHFVKLLSVFLCVLSVLSIANAQSCPANGIACYPTDCCSQYRQCVGTTFYPPQNTAPGTVCKGGMQVWASECTTPCGSVAPPPSSATTRPTPATQAPQQPKPATQAPATQAPARPATQAPATQAPKPATQAPATQAPATQAPKPATQAPATQAPATQAPKPATQAPTPATQSPSTGGCSLADVFTKADFNTLFPHANGGAIEGRPNQHAIFNYTYLLDAAKRFPLFACEGDVATRKREVAAFLAQTSQETSGWWAGQPYNWGYFFSTEVGCDNANCQNYCGWSSDYPCAAGKGYFGRGPMQLSWNYNYGQVSKYLYGNDVLLRNPDMMFDEGGTAFTTALWFWMTPQSPKPSAHDVMVGRWTPNTQDVAAGRLPGFGMTTNIINGGLECNQRPTPAKVVNRMGYFTTYCAHFGISAGSNVNCDSMRSF